MLGAGSVRAQQATGPSHCTDSTRSYLAITTPEVAADDPVAWPEVVRHVGSELRLRELELCATPKPGRPLATLRLERVQPSGVEIALLLAPGEPPLAARTLDLEPVPPDARLLAIAVAADELLASNLAELRQRAAQARERAEPALPAAPPPAPAEPRVELGLAFVGDVFGGGQELLGVDALVGARFARRLAVTARLGIRQGLPTAADHGSVQARALVFGGGLRFAAMTSDQLRVDVLARLDALSVGVEAYPTAGADAQAQQGLAFAASGGAGLRWALSSSLELLLQGNVGGALHAVHITDTGRRVSGVSDLALGAGGGVLAAF